MSDVCSLLCFSDPAGLQFSVRRSEVHRLHADRGTQGDQERHLGQARRRILPGNVPNLHILFAKQIFIL